MHVTNPGPYPQSVPAAGLTVDVGAVAAWPDELAVPATLVALSDDEYAALATGTVAALAALAPLTAIPAPPARKTRRSN